jgi:putative mRNA 3-end processing factor
VLTLTKQGLYCPAGQFYIDPRGAVDHAVITHAHSDHARRGSRNYYCARSGVGLLKARIGQKISVRGIDFRESFQLGAVTVSFHPAGHILGSSQVRMEFCGEVWVASGDYKRDFDPTCEPFESVPCDVFVTEATFGTPAYSWEKNKDLGEEIHQWWCENAKRGVNSVLFAYSLGKTQRVLGLLERFGKTVYCHPAARTLIECYRAEGVRLAPTLCLSDVQDHERLKGELILTPQSFLSDERVKILNDAYVTAFASGWMAKRQFGYDRGFVMSDHADWNDLVQTITQTKAKRVYVQHRGSGALVRHLRTMGIMAFPEEQLAPADPQQMVFF